MGVETQADARSVVYYLASQYGGVVKIGTTVDIDSRVRRMQRAQPAAEFIVLATEPGGVRVEQQRHREFARSRQQGEWFWLTPHLREHIDTIRSAQ
jgi:hypothetical protein